MRIKKENEEGMLGALSAVVVVICSIATTIIGYISNIVWIIKQDVITMSGEMIISIIGVIIPPIGIIHGIYTWF
jgi:hypothetical protein